LTGLKRFEIGSVMKRKREEREGLFAFSLRFIGGNATGMAGMILPDGSSYLTENL
jgi:hypothetical protein